MPTKPKGSRGSERVGQSGGALLEENMSFASHNLFYADVGDVLRLGRHRVAVLSTLLPASTLTAPKGDSAGPVAAVKSGPPSRPAWRFILVV
jgi:hypothetical protein